MTRRLQQLWLAASGLGLGLVWPVAESAPGEFTLCGSAGPVDWPVLAEQLWAATADSVLSDELLPQLLQLQEPALLASCPDGSAAAMALLAAHFLGAGQLEVTKAADFYISPLQLDMSLPAALGLTEAEPKFSVPLFASTERLATKVAAAATERGEAGCRDRDSVSFRQVLLHHLADRSKGALPIPMLQALEYAAKKIDCPAGKAAALLSVALSLLGESEVEARERRLAELMPLVERAEGYLRELRLQDELVALTGDDAKGGWPIWSLLARLEGALAPRRPKALEDADRLPPLQGCLLLIYAFPTDEIRNDTAQALRDMETHYVQPLSVRHPLIVFTDEATSKTLATDLGQHTSLEVIPAVIPKEELGREMNSYSCIDGLNCVAGLEANTGAHRAVVNGAQYWSPNYLRISRYTAGPLFQHPALDRCGAFLKVDTDLFLTGPVDRDPVEEIRQEGSRLAYWQIHVQGQRQQGYMDAAVSYMEDRGIRIKNKAFYARGRFEERAAKLGIPVSEVPEALEAATVIYGCLFGGDVRFFREPLYRDFFAYMDTHKGFETYGWSNQFFLGTVGAALVWPSQIRRLYIAGRHQESHIETGNGTVTEFLLGSTKGVFR
eukprot:TRINITY_DN112690_c0_g1_i1.p1 TRINITY_DN112690_c0_g1~~TRINITY_DN112690_c0_g1_i1.p1  ORF type:complete len:642 (-),score=142.75 TRINITY_DN112690_c0_g1_i1:82-1914(-)